MSLTWASQKWYPGEYRSSIGTCCTAPKKHAKYDAQTTGYSSLRRNRAEPRPRSQQSAHEAINLRALFQSRRGRAPASTQIRPRADLALPPHALAAGWLQLPAPADLLGLWRRGDRKIRAVGRRLDDAGAPAPLQPFRHLGHRQRAPHHATSRTLVLALALRPLARCQRILSMMRRLMRRYLEWNRNSFLALM